MMTLHGLSAGDGYAYYTNEVATGDVKRESGRELGDYYTAEGNPAGVWLGSGTALLGVTGAVSEGQMRALYGEGIHPEADRIIMEMTARGASSTQAQAAVKLGRRYYSYDQPDGSLAGKIRDGYTEFERINHREPDAEDRRKIRTREGAIAFRQAKGRDAANAEELGRFITASARPGQQAVAGFDLVFSPAKSVSTLWALGDEETRCTIETAHEDAIADTVDYLEREAIATRAGTNGVAQIEVEGGLVATRFRHYDSRAGDPQLHDHVVVANKVRGVDGRWRTIDSKLLHRQGVAASEFYNQRVIANVAQRLGVTTEYREVTAGKRPVLEIAGIDARLTETFSSRSADIKATVRRLTREYRREHGRAPDAKARIALAQRATLETRPAKPTARSLKALRQTWRNAAVAATDERTVGQLLSHAQSLATVPATRADLDVDVAARAVVATVSEHHAVWGAHTIEAETRRYLQRTVGPLMVTEDDVTRVARAALAEQSITVTPPAPHQAFEPLTRSDGSSIYEHKGRTLYTSSGVLDAEDRLLQAGRSRSFAPVSAAQFEATLVEHGSRLDDGQRALARAFATDELALIVGTGPAGAGKTTALRVAARAVESAGHKLIGLAPSAAAALVFSEDAEVSASTIHSFLSSYDARGDVTADSGHPEEHRLSPGDVIVVDEAGMAGTVNLAKVTSIAERHGALVRLIGDDRQLGAVEAGGALRLLERELGSVRLETVHRFRDEQEAAATLTLRDPLSTGDAFGWHMDNGRVVAGSREQMVDTVFGAWQQDMVDGRDSLMLAQTNESVRELNARAQAFRMSTGEVHGRQTATLSDGASAHVGDVIVTRRNEAQMRLGVSGKRIHNGDRWEVLAVRKDGSLTVRHESVHGKLTIPADYVKQHTELGYASTIHRAQGATVDRSHVLADASTTRELAYVGLTRGREENRLYVHTEDAQDMREVLDGIARNHDGALSAHETIRDEQARVDSVPVLMDQYQDIRARVDNERYQGAAYFALTTETADAVIASEVWPAFAQTMREAEEAGHNPAYVLNAADAQSELTDVDDMPSVLLWRMNQELDARGREPVITDQLRVPRWIADESVLTDQRVPENWKAHLTERFEHLATRLEERGMQLAAEPPAWAKDLGRVPVDPIARAEWARTAAEVDVFRARYRVSDTEQVAIPAQYQRGDLGAALNRRVAAIARVDRVHTSEPAKVPAGERSRAAETAHEHQAVRGEAVPSSTVEADTSSAPPADGLTSFQRRMLERSGRTVKSAEEQQQARADAAEKAAASRRAADRPRGNDRGIER